MHVDVEIKLYRHVDMEKTCRPQHYFFPIGTVLKEIIYASHLHNLNLIKLENTSKGGACVVIV